EGLRAPQIDAGAGHVALPAAGDGLEGEGHRAVGVLNRGSKEVADEMIAADFRRQTQPLVGVVGEGTSRTVVVKIIKRLGSEIYVLEEAGDLPLRRQQSPRVAIPGIILPVRHLICRARRRGCWHREQCTRGWSDTEIARRGACRRRAFHLVVGLACCARILLLRTEW